jgi:pimeloyl-ACP methyl ester carboxylesterase/DNA-binding CsgD family transcriptional regulator
MPPDRASLRHEGIQFLPVTGGRVAVAASGTGAPLVLPAPWVSHVELEGEFPPYRDFVRRLGERHTVVRYDRLGVGLSDPDPGGPRPDLGTEATRLGELVDVIGLDEVRLFGVSWGGCVAIAYAARQPPRLAGVATFGCPVVGADIASPALRDSVLSTVRAHWGVGARLLADIWIPGAQPDVRAEFARLQRAALSAEAAALSLEAVYAVDLRALLPSVRVPLLVLHRRHDRAAPFAAARELAAGVAGARLAPLDGAVHPPWLGDVEGVLDALEPFLAGDQQAPGGTSPARPAAHLPVPPAGLLSPREVEVLRLVAAGLTDDDIAARLVVSPHTVHRHVANVRTKLGQPSRAAAVATAHRLGLI